MNTNKIYELEYIRINQMTQKKGNERRKKRAREKEENKTIRVETMLMEIKPKNSSKNCCLTHYRL